MDKDNMFSKRLGRQGYLIMLFLFYIILKVPAISIPRVRNEGHSDWKRKDKIVPIWDDMIGEASLVAQRLKRLPAMRETWVQSLGWEDFPGEGNGNPLQYSCLENPMDRGAWWATVHRVTKSWTWLSDLTVCIQQRTKENLLDSTGNSTWFSMVA